MANSESLNVNSRAAVRAAGVRALREALGPVGMARFFQQIEDGRGDYTREKYERPDASFDELDAALKQLDRRD